MKTPASVLALSVKPYRACQLSQRESLWRNRTLCNSNRKASRYAKASPFGRGGTAQAVTERASLPPRSAALSQKAALQLPFPSMPPPVKRGFRKARRLF